MWILYGSNRISCCSFLFVLCLSSCTHSRFSSINNKSSMKTWELRILIFEWYFKTIHLPDLQYVSLCLLFGECDEQQRGWPESMVTMKNCDFTLDFHGNWERFVCSWIEWSNLKAIWWHAFEFSQVYLFLKKNQCRCILTSSWFLNSRDINTGILKGEHLRVSPIQMIS